MKHLLKLSLILLAFLLPATAAASPITLQQAQQNALSFLESKGKSISSSSLRQARLRSASTTTESYYIFNIGSNEGYVIAAGDDCAPDILGYADAGYIDVDSMPVNLQSWLEEYAQQIQFMQENGYSPSKAPKLTSSYSAISPLLATTWDQLDPYNQNCPDFFGYGKCVTGCVATAMAQVMYYHRARSVTQTTTQIPAYTCRHRWISGTDTMQIHVAAIPAGSPIDWDNMLDSYGSSATTAQEQAVANLMKYCGASVQMDYANEWNGGSGAYSTDVPTALKTYFDYSSATVLKNRSDYSTNDAWESLIYNELSSSRPVYYSGRNSSAGHAFVCDGYDGSGYYHINWGWSGTSDGYFLLTALDPNQQGTGGSSSGYNQNQAALINAQPKSSSPSNPVLATSISLNNTSAELNTGETLQLTATVLPSNATNKTVTWTTSNSSVATVSSNGLVTAKAVGNATITARTIDGSNLSASCSVTVKQSSVLATSISLNKTSAEVSMGETLLLTATVLPNDATNRTVTWTTSDSSIATVSINGLVTAKAPGTATITARTTDSSDLSASCSVTVKQNVVLATSISLNKTNAELVEGNTIQLTATVLPSNATNKSVTWTSSNSSVAEVNDGLVTANSPGMVTITAATTDGSDLEASCVLSIRQDVNNYDNYLSINNITALPGDTILIPVAMFNKASILSLQTDLFLPSGLYIIQNDGEYAINSSDRMTQGHIMMSDSVSNGAIRVLCYSSNGKPFKGDSGDDLFYIAVKVVDNAKGDYLIQLRNSLFTLSDFNEITAPDVIAKVNVEDFLLGDANASGTVSITDVVVTAQYVLEKDPQPFVYEAADVNMDNNITVADVVRIAYMVLNPNATNALLLKKPSSDDVVENYLSGNDFSLIAGETQTVNIKLDKKIDYCAFQLDITLPDGLITSDFSLSNCDNSHVFEVNNLNNGKARVLCYSPTLMPIKSVDNVLLTFDVSTNRKIVGDITIDGIEMVTPSCQTVLLDTFNIGVNSETAVCEYGCGKRIDHFEYYNIAGHRIDQPDGSVILVVIFYSDGTRLVKKIINNNHYFYKLN